MPLDQLTEQQAKAAFLSLPTSLEQFVRLQKCVGGRGVHWGGLSWKQKLSLGRVGVEGVRSNHKVWQSVLADIPAINARGASRERAVLASRNSSRTGRVKIKVLGQDIHVQDPKVEARPATVPVQGTVPDPVNLPEPVVRPETSGPAPGALQYTKFSKLLANARRRRVLPSQWYQKGCNNPAGFYEDYIHFEKGCCEKGSCTERQKEIHALCGGDYNQLSAAGRRQMPLPY